MESKGKFFLILSVIVVFLVVAFMFVFYARPFRGAAIEGIDSDKGKEEPIYYEEQEEDFFEGDELGQETVVEGKDSNVVAESSEGGEEVVQEVMDDSEPTAILNLLDFDYEIVESDLVKVKRLSYSIENLNRGPIFLEILIYIYGEDDDNSKKGIVGDQISIGEASYGESITDTVDVRTYYRGDLATEKIVKITLVGYYIDRSYNLGSDSKGVVFK